MSEFFNEMLDSDEELDDIDHEIIPFLKNSKQIGDKPTGIEIYLEDYVYTYLYQYSKLNRGEEKGAALVGHYIEEENKKMTVICGAIQLDSSLSEGSKFFTEKQIQYINKKIDTYFPGYELVGWMHTQPGYGIFLTTQDITIQNQFFKEPYKTLMIIDPIENAEAFFLWDKKEVRSVEGYFIYYDKNEKMQNYMVNHKVGVSNEELEEKEDVVMHFRQKERERKKEVQNKKIVHLVTSLSVVLFLMCVTMAIGLIQHRERITKLEQDLNNMDKNYTNLLSQISKEDVQVVFAETSKNPQDIEETLKEDDDLGEIAKDLPDVDEVITIEDNTEDIKENNKPIPKEEVKEEKEETSDLSQDIEYDTYTVEKGDNLNRISYQHYKNLDMVKEIVELNNLESPDKIYEGQVLKLPRL